MSDEPDDLVLRLLREIREEQSNTKQAVQKLSRRLDDTTELMTQAMGLAAFANVRTDSFDDRIALVEDRVAALANQVRDMRR